MITPEELCERLAALAVEVGANVQPGQVVAVSADLGQEAMARAVAACAYRRGARFVDVTYFDPYVKRVRLLHAPEETLDFVPSWYGERVLELGRQRAATIALTGPAPSDALKGVDPGRAGRDQLPEVRESMIVINERSINWTVVPCPTPTWAQLAYPELAAADAMQRLCHDLWTICRLDQPDPGAAWLERMSELAAVAERLTVSGLDAVHFEGEGTDLTVGLLPTSAWHSAGPAHTLEGISHLANLPSEEVFTTPDPERTDGVVRSTRPLMLSDGTLIEGLAMRFDAGRAIEISADKGAEVLRGRAALDEGASRLGEVALVDGKSPIGRADRIFYDTLIDENAVSHVALGSGYESPVGEPDRPRVNRSAIHIDFMIGGDEVAVTGIMRDGSRVPVLRGGTWQV